MSTVDCLDGYGMAITDMSGILNFVICQTFHCEVLYHSITLTVLSFIDEPGTLKTVYQLENCPASHFTLTLNFIYFTTQSYKSATR